MPEISQGGPRIEMQAASKAKNKNLHQDSISTLRLLYLHQTPGPNTKYFQHLLERFGGVSRSQPNVSKSLSTCIAPKKLVSNPVSLSHRKITVQSQG